MAGKQQDRQANQQDAFDRLFGGVGQWLAGTHSHTRHKFPTKYEARYLSSRRVCVYKSTPSPQDERSDDDAILRVTPAGSIMQVVFQAQAGAQAQHFQTAVDPAFGFRV
ncbi:hypothetical protein D3C75_1056060 [compost metagenome]